MSKQLDLVISILKESATAHKIGDTVWAKDSVKRYITHAGKIVDISPGKITIKKLSGALTTHNTEDVSKDYEHLNPNPYRKNESEEIEESFTVKDASGKVVHVALTQSAAEKKAAELQASTKEKHTAGYSRESVVKEEWNAAYAEGKRHGSQGTGNNGQKAKKDWGDDFHHYNRGFLEGRNAKAKSLKAVGQGYGKKTNEAEDLEELNKSTIDSYKEKATDELKQAKKYSKSEYGDLAKRVIARRTKGLARVADRNESESLDEMGYGQAPWWRPPATSGSAMPAKYHVKDRATGKVISTHANAPDAAKARNKVGSADTHSIIKESSMSDLASGKGDGKELKASPEYRRDRRRTAQMLAAQKEVQARVKRGYAEDDKDLDESLDEAHKLGDRVKIVGGVSKDVIGVHGHIGEIRNGAFKGAPKTYTVDYQHPKHSSKNTSSIQLSKEHIRGAKPGTLGEGLDEGILSRITNKVMGAAPKEPKYKVGQVVSYETPENQPDWKDHGRGKGTITKYSNGHYIVNGNPVNHFDIKKVHESVDPDESSKGHTMEAHGVKGSIEEVSTARLKSYAEKAREDAEKLTKQGDAAKTDKTKLAKYVKATKRHLNAHKADDKISSNEFYGKK